MIQEIGGSLDSHPPLPSIHPRSTSSPFLARSGLTSEEEEGKKNPTLADFSHNFAGNSRFPPSVQVGEIRKREFFPWRDTRNAAWAAAAAAAVFESVCRRLGFRLSFPSPCFPGKKTRSRGRRNKEGDERIRDQQRRQNGDPTLWG